MLLQSCDMLVWRRLHLSQKDSIEEEEKCLFRSSLCWSNLTRQFVLKLPLLERRCPPWERNHWGPSEHWDGSDMWAGEAKPWEQKQVWTCYCVKYLPMIKLKPMLRIGWEYFNLVGFLVDGMGSLLVKKKKKRKLVLFNSKSKYHSINTLIIIQVLIIMQLEVYGYQEGVQALNKKLS